MFVVESTPHPSGPSLLDLVYGRESERDRRRWRQHQALCGWEPSPKKGPLRLFVRRGGVWCETYSTVWAMRELVRERMRRLTAFLRGYELEGD